jgi:hypothetical protein
MLSLAARNIYIMHLRTSQKYVYLFHFGIFIFHSYEQHKNIMTTNITTCAANTNLLASHNEYNRFSHHIKF